MILLGVCELLSTFRQGICGNSGTPYIINKEGRGVVVGALSTACLSIVKGIIVLKPPYTVVTNAPTQCMNMMNDLLG